jgi:hypothetical protein
MTFRDLKSGYPVYLLDRTALKYEQGKVMAVSTPHADVTPGNYGKMLVDITIQTNGNQNTYSVCDTEQTAYANNLLLTTCKECVIHEVNALRNDSEQILSKIEEHKSIVAKCDTLIAELDTAYRDQQKTNERLDNLENKLDEIFKFVKQKS